VRGAHPKETQCRSWKSRSRKVGSKESLGGGITDASGGKIMFMGYHDVERKEKALRTRGVGGVREITQKRKREEGAFNKTQYCRGTLQGHLIRGGGKTKVTPQKLSVAFFIGLYGNRKAQRAQKKSSTRGGLTFAVNRDSFSTREGRLRGNFRRKG